MKNTRLSFDGRWGPREETNKSKQCLPLSFLTPFLTWFVAKCQILREQSEHTSTFNSIKKQANKKHTNKQTNKQTNTLKQTNEQTNKQTNKQNEKNTSHFFSIFPFIGRNSKITTTKQTMNRPFSHENQVDM